MPRYPDPSWTDEERKRWAEDFSSAEISALLLHFRNRDLDLVVAARLMIVVAGLLWADSSLSQEERDHIEAGFRTAVAAIDAAGV